MRKVWTRTRKTWVFFSNAENEHTATVWNFLICMKESWDNWKEIYSLYIQNIQFIFISLKTHFLYTFFPDLKFRHLNKTVPDIFVTTILFYLSNLEFPICILDNNRLQNSFFVNKNKFVPCGNQWNAISYTWQKNPFMKGVFIKITFLCLHFMEYCQFEWTCHDKLLVFIVYKIHRISVKV